MIAYRLRYIWVAAIIFASVLMNVSVVEAKTDAIGKVIVASGTVSAVKADGKSVRLKRRSAIHAGDHIITGAKSAAQIRFSDGAMLALVENSEFKIEDYNYTGDADGTEKASFSLLKGGMRTITGIIGKANKDNYEVKTEVATIGIRGTHYVLRTCSGNCGGNQGMFGGVINGAISVKNSAGEQQVGGSQFFHVQDMDSPPQLLLTPPPFLSEAMQSEQEEGDEEGSDGNTSQGDENNGENRGDTDSEEGNQDDGTSNDGEPNEPGDQPSPQEGGDDGQEPTSGEGGDEPLLMQPPPEPEDGPAPVSSDESLLDSGDSFLLPPLLDDSANTSSGSDSGVSRPYPAAPSGSIIGFEFMTNDTKEGIWSGGGILILDDKDYVGLTDINGASNIPILGEIYFPSSTHTDPDGNIIVEEGCNPCTLSIGSSALQEVGGVGGAGKGVNWGRWDGDYLITENGAVENTLGSLHFIYSPNTTPYSVVQNLTGFITYTKVGGTSPTDEAGVAGTLNSAYVDVDFSNQDIYGASLSLSVNGKSISMSADVTNGYLKLAEIYDEQRPIEMTGTCNGGSCGTSMNMRGDWSIMFVGDSAERIMSTYGISQDVDTSIGEKSSVGVSGTVVLDQSGGV